MTQKSPPEEFKSVLSKRKAGKSIRPRNHIREGFRAGARGCVPYDYCCTKMPGSLKNTAHLQLSAALEHRLSQSSSM